MILEQPQVLERPPCALVLEMLPVAPDGIEFGRVGRQEDESDIAGNDQVPGHVKRSPVHDHDVCRPWVLLAEGVHEDLEGLCVECRQLQEEAVSGCRFDRPEQVVVPGRHLLSHFRLHDPASKEETQGGRTQPRREGGQSACLQATGARRAQ